MTDRRVQETDATDPGWVPEGVLNFRDLGGLPVVGGGRVRRGRLFRSATPQLMTEGDLEWLRSRIGLRTVIDLRFAKESAAEGCGLLADSDIAVVNIPFRVPKPADLSTPVAEQAPAQISEVLGPFYVGMVELSAERIARAVHLLVDDGMPALFHCAAGKDRTGILAALLLSTVGVPDDAVVADYVRTNESLDRMMAQLRSLDFYADRVHLQEPQRNTVDGGVMQGFLDGLRRTHGSPREYLLGAGVTEAELAVLRDDLVER
ncbi:tyrosine-protein phosphatase [Blastococcus sp. URHD0036]|uniref:tyrosine-protein phosphatase n=1 Tax=Blastococcus sp. URHD0036 TaxID=1380356 RepID=UPI0018CC2745|nr:tyrosine-protein phosphatase [Blastococcus sp. URHD0036]